ncbi:MAG: AAA family ATPase [Cytophagales bacterium]
MIGSQWRKWDLHIHTPSTKMNNNYGLIDDELDKFSTILEESDVYGFGITDYFSIDNYLKFIDFYKNKYPNSKKLFLPNIEFRLDISVNKKSEEINIHVIFSNTINSGRIKTFLNNLSTHLRGENNAKKKCSELTDNDYSSATVSIDDLQNCLNDIFGKDNCYLVVTAANNAGLRPTNSPRKLTLTDEIDKVSDAFFGGTQNVEYYLKTDRYEGQKLSHPKPVISGSDAHSYEEINDRLGKNHNVEIEGKLVNISETTWIKSDLTFEGLRQIKFEPQHRIKITINEPRQPRRKIESIKLNFPDDAEIKNSKSDASQPFCLNRLKKELHFSPYFTSIVGGRGTGKSTIINLLAQKLGIENKFFSETKIYNGDGSPITINESSKEIEINGTNEIEYVSQGTIENLANQENLTKLIFNERIRLLNSDLLKLETSLETEYANIERNIFIANEIIKDVTLKDSLSKEQATFEAIIDSINDAEYIEITKRIGEITKNISEIESSAKDYTELLSEVADLISKYDNKDFNNYYSNRINEIIEILKNLEEIKEPSKEKQPIVDEEKFLENLKKDLNDQKEKLQKFFEEKGTNEDSIQDSEMASDKLNEIKLKYESVNTRLQRHIKVYKTNSSDSNKLERLRNDIIESIDKNIVSINERLKTNDKNVSLISFDHSFNVNLFLETLFQDFIEEFEPYFLRNTPKDKIKEALYCIQPEEVIEIENGDIIEAFEIKFHDLGFNEDANFVRILIAIFSDKWNIEKYKNLIMKHYYNYPEYVKINGKYGNRELSSCSFGQRCTAVIVTLLMTGVKPLVIDEPEAHLDNKLVADYLVHLIKEKKYDRQVIFATHNSNFVVNGDSELIHCLEIPGDKVFTEIESIKIETVHKRDLLLRLEGGIEAFKTRENKYGI